MTFSNPLAGEILDYLIRHPQAKDTVEGITEWWLLEQRIKNALIEVKAALNELVAKGFVVAQQNGDKRIHYGLNANAELGLSSLSRKPRTLRKPPKSSKGHA